MSLKMANHANKIPKPFVKSNARYFDFEINYGSAGLWQ